MLSPRLAIRNILAHSNRSRTMFIVVALVSAVLFLLLSFSDGETENLKSGVIALNEPAADIVVYGAGLKAALDRGEDWQRLAPYFMADSGAVLTELRALGFVRRAADPTSGFSLDIVAKGKRFENFFMRGVDEASPYLVEDRLLMKEGRFLSGSAEPEVILHYKTASTLGLEPGDALRISGKDLFGQVVSQEAVLAGYFSGAQDTPNLGEIGFMNMAAYRSVSGLEASESKEILVDLKKGESVERGLAELADWAERGGRKLEFWSFDDTPKSLRVADLLRTYGLFRAIIYVIAAIVILIVAFGLVNVVSVNLYDRKREIATYYCLGSGKLFLSRVYALEIALLNVAASAAGVAIGLGLGAILNALGIETESSGMQLVFGGSRFHMGFSLASGAAIVAAILLVSLATAAATIGSSLRVPPVEALRETE